MTRTVKVLIAVLVVALLGVGGFAVFEYFEKHDKVKDAERPCGSLNSPVAGVALPSTLKGFSLPDDQKLLEVSTQGKTVIVFAVTPGSRDDLVSLRDKVVTQMNALGFKASATDQEPTYEAEGQFTGDVAGTIQVQPQCEGFDRIRYKFNL
jgi:hypothetical protein